MKTSYILLFTGLMFCLACSPKQKKETTHSNSPEETSTAQVSAANGLQMGEVDYIIGDHKGKIIDFEKGHTDITISKNQIAYRIRNMKDLNFIIGLYGNGIQENATHDYVPIASASDDASYTFLISIIGLQKDDIMNPYKVYSGTLKVEQLNLETGKVKAKIQGKASRARDVNNKNPIDFSLKIDMQVDNVINMVQHQ